MLKAQPRQTLATITEVSASVGEEISGEVELGIYFYPKGQEPRVRKQLAAKHIPVTVLTHSAAVAEANKKPVHHKLRYIAGGIVLALIVIAGVVLLARRQRTQAD